LFREIFRDRDSQHCSLLFADGDCTRRAILGFENEVLESRWN